MMVPCINHKIQGFCYFCNQNINGNWFIGFSGKEKPLLQLQLQN